MNLLGFLIPTWAVALVAAAIGALLSGGVQQLRIANLNTAHAQTKLAWADERAALEKDRAAAERKAREAESQRADAERDLNTIIATNAEDAIREQRVYETRIAAARAESRGLLDQLSALKSAYQRDAASAVACAAGDQPPAAEAVGVLADLLGRCEERAVERAGFADAAHAAAVNCATDYEAARAALVKVDAP